MELSSGELLVQKQIKDITVMGFLCEFDVNESQSLMDDQGRYKSFEAKIIPAVASPDHYLPTACDLHSIRRVSASLSVVSFRYKQPIREVQQTLRQLSSDAELAQKEKSLADVVKNSSSGKKRRANHPKTRLTAMAAASNQ